MGLMLFLMILSIGVAVALGIAGAIYVAFDVLRSDYCSRDKKRKK